MILQPGRGTTSLEIDDSTGLLTALHHLDRHGGRRRVAIATTIQIVNGGSEQRGPTGGVITVDTVTISTVSRGSVNTASELAIWLAERDRSLPPGALTAHHVDSHDTFWWPLWGKKWRRQQFGTAPVRALTVAYLLCGGPFMMFTGGEEGIDDVLAAANAAKRKYLVLTRGVTDYTMSIDHDRHVFVVARRLDQRSAVIVVNLGESTTTVTVPCDGKHDADLDGGWVDVLGLPGVGIEADATSTVVTLAGYASAVLVGASVRGLQQ